MEDFRKILEKFASTLNSILLGKADIVEYSTVCLLAGGHLLLEDLPGVGKTTLASGIAKAVTGTFNRIQFSADLLPSDILGTKIYKRHEECFEFIKGPVFANFVLADELNRAPPKTQSALLQAMSEGMVSMDGIDMPLPAPFMVIATQNPRGFHGTYPLPESQRDRFLMRLSIGHPDEGTETMLLEEKRTRDFLEKIRPVTDSGNILAMQAAIAEVEVPKTCLDYIVRLISHTRNHAEVIIPISPRGSISLMKASQALAWLRGKENVCIDIIKELAPYILSHRITLKSSIYSRGEGATPDWITRELLQKVEVE